MSGYSQGLLKMVLEKGHLEEDVEDDVEDEDVEGEAEQDAEGTVQMKAKKRKLDPMGGLRKAIGHQAYSMLKVVD